MAAMRDRSARDEQMILSRRRRGGSCARPLVRQLWPVACFTRRQSACVPAASPGGPSSSPLPYLARQERRARQAA
jgi:hypothetical protein